MITGRIAADAKGELIIKPSTFSTTTHNVVSIVRNYSETINIFPFAVTGEVLYSIYERVLTLFLPVNARI